MRTIPVALAFALVLLAGRPAPVDSPQALGTLELVRSTVPPTRALADLRARIVAPSGWSTAPAASDEAFWINDIVNNTYRLVPVELRHVSTHADWFVERGRASPDLSASAEFFESRIFPDVTTLTGVRWSPGENGQPRVAIFHGQTPGVAGYMSAGDAESHAVFPYSNERPIIYLSLDALRPGTNPYYSTLAHELEHLAHSFVNPIQEGWLDEGLAELVANLVMGAPPPATASFRAQSDVQLTAWSQKPWEARAHYEASTLFARYLMERGGGPAALADLVGAGGQGITTAERFATAHGLAPSSDALLLDWLVANLLDAPEFGDGRFGYSTLDQRSAITAAIRAPSEVVEGQVHQHAGDYYEIEFAGPAELRVEVNPEVSLIPTSNTRGAFFWGLRGDNLDTRMTRRFELGGLQAATLRFRLWYDVEPDFDFCYVLGSRDGLRWLPLRSRYTTDRNSVGLAFGPGYTGRSGGEAPTWVDEELDLTPLTGGSAQIRFECVTDQNYSAPGFAVDDLAIPEIGFSDDGEGDQGWHLEGFVRAPNSMAQSAAVRLVEVGSDGLSVRDLTLDSTGRGGLYLEPTPGRGRRVFVIVAGLAPRTLEEMNYRLWLAAPVP